MTHKTMLIGLSLLVVAAGVYIWASQTRRSALLPEPSAAVLQGKSKDEFIQIIAAYCRKHLDAHDMASCVACDDDTCPDCGFGSDRLKLVSGCNTGNWDCAASVIFPPATGGSCAFAPSGPCQCPVQ
jgi:hypothetical protein